MGQDGPWVVLEDRPRPSWLVRKSEILGAAGTGDVWLTLTSNESDHFLSTCFVPGRVQALCYLSSCSQCPKEVGLVIVSILQMSKLRLRVMKQLSLR